VAAKPANVVISAKRSLRTEANVVSECTIPCSRLMNSIRDYFLHFISGGVSTRVPDVSYPNLFVIRRLVPGVLKEGWVRYLELGLGLVLMRGLGVSVRVSG